jgi:hypothetical protein
MATTTTFTGMGLGFAVTAAATIARNAQAQRQRKEGFIDCDGTWESRNRMRGNKEFGIGTVRLRYTMVEKREEMV